MNLPLLGPFDGPVPPLLRHLNVYRSGGTSFTVSLPALGGVDHGQQIAVQRHVGDQAGGAITFQTPAPDTIAGERTSFDLVNPGDLYLLEADLRDGLQVWTVIDMQTSSRLTPSAAELAATYVTYDGTNLRKNGTVIPITGGGGGAVSVVDNGDGTFTISTSSASPSTAVVGSAVVGSSIAA